MLMTMFATPESTDLVVAVLSIYCFHDLWTPVLHAPTCCFAHGPILLQQYYQSTASRTCERPCRTLPLVVLHMGH